MEKAVLDKVHMRSFNNFYRSLNIAMVAPYIVCCFCIAVIAGRADADSVTNLLWQASFEPAKFASSWGMANAWVDGSYNMELMKCDAPSGGCLRVHYAAGTYDPGSMIRAGAKVGGVEFNSSLGIAPRDALNLRYYVKFPQGFDFVKGGKLPGLFGGTANTGGKIPNGTDGFTTRYMWREQGAGEIYAYLPSSVNYGTSIGRGSWHFIPGQWTLIEQSVKLNTPGIGNGNLRVWVNEKLVVDRHDVLFRSVDYLKLQGIIFSTFFGGNDQSWATPVDTYVDFSDFAVSGGTYIGRVIKN